MGAAHDRREALRLLALPALSVLLPTPAFAKDVDASDVISPEAARQQRAQSEASEVLRIELENLMPGLALGWIVPPNLLLSTNKQPKWEYIYPFEFGFRTAPFSRRLTAAEVSRIARTYPDALCNPNEEWFSYRAPNTVRAKTKALILPDRPANVRLGMYRGPVPPNVVTRDFQPAQGPLHVRSNGLLSADKRHRFVEYVGYDEVTTEVRRMSVVLYERGWTLIARQDEDFGEADTWCDGCATPRLADGIDRVFGTFGMIALGGYPYPLLLSDRSSIETRTLTLSTFLDDGRFARDYRVQIFVGCPSLEALIKSTS